MSSVGSKRDEMNEIVIKACQEKIVRLRQEIKELEDHIQRVMRGEDGTGPSTTPDSDNYPDVQVDQYRTMKMGTALQAYLSDRAGLEVPVYRVMQDLTKGGVKTLVKQNKATPEKTEAERLRYVRICIGNNLKKVEWNSTHTAIRYKF